MAYNPFDDVIENDPAYMKWGMIPPKIGSELLMYPQTFERNRSVI